MGISVDDFLIILGQIQVKEGEIQEMEIDAYLIKGLMEYQFSTQTMTKDCVGQITGHDDMFIIYNGNRFHLKEKKNG